MKNSYFKIILTLFLTFLSFNTLSEEQFNFDVTEVEILNNGNKFIGKKKGTITTNDGVIIDANTFEYDKLSNILYASGNVKVNDTVNQYIIYSEKIIYDKNQEIIYTKNKSKGVSEKDRVIISAKNFQYNKLSGQIFTEGNSKAIDLVKKDELSANKFNFNIPENIIIAENNVTLKNEIEDYNIFTDFLTYFKNEEKINTRGKTSALIHSKYDFNSADVLFLKNSMELSSNKNTTIKDKLNLYNLSRFKYLINQKELKGEQIIISSNYNLPKSDKFYFSSAIINLENENFVAKDTKIKIHKSVFGEKENDPRLYGTSSKKNGNITKVNKGIFTSCKENQNGDCPPWSLQASEIKHNENKKQLIYKNAVLKVYDFPVLYFPKFFHPDPSVKRQSGLLKPQINSSEELGDSIHLPYFHVISPTKDLTFRPTFFNNSIKMFQNEYRQKNKNSSFITDFSLTTGYKSSLSNKKNSISHLFAKFNSDLKLKNFNYSDLYISVQKVSNDTYLKVFDTNLPETELKPSSDSSLESEIKLSLNNESYNFATGAKVFENLEETDSDRFQYILPYYDFDKDIEFKPLKGILSFTSAGSNDLSNTNNLKSKIINDFRYKGNEKISNLGFINNFNIYFKNSNTLGKHDDNYKSSPQIELMNIYEYSSKLPLIKKKGNFNNYLTPTISFRFNPSDMKDYSSTSRILNVENIFSINRLGFDDSFEKGRSLTVGLNYKKENLNNINKYFELKLGSVFRDKEEDFIPTSSSLNKKNSNLFGAIEGKFTKNFTVDYNFIIDNNYDRVEYNSINTKFLFKNLETKFNFVEENGVTGDENFLENSTIYKINESNLISFNTRRNRKLNLTEFYDLLYEYKNDCLVASVKYNKKYYSDRDLKPSENLLLTLTLYPLTTYEHNETNLFKD